MFLDQPRSAPTTLHVSRRGLSGIAGDDEVNHGLEWQGGTMSGTVAKRSSDLMRRLEIHGGKLARAVRLTEPRDGDLERSRAMAATVPCRPIDLQNEGSLDIDVPEGGERTLAGGDDGDAGLVAGTFNNTGTLTKSARGH